MYHISKLFPCLNGCCWQHLLSADYLREQFGSRSGLTNHWAWSGSKLFGTLMIFEKIVLFIKICRPQKGMQNRPSTQIVNYADELNKKGLHYWYSVMLIVSGRLARSYHLNFIADHLLKLKLFLSRTKQVLMLMIQQGWQQSMSYDL